MDKTFKNRLETSVGIGGSMSIHSRSGWERVDKEKLDGQKN
jgi:hypothetical protein